MPPVKRSAEPGTVMVYSMGEVIGDGVIKLPFIAALRDAYPASRIIWCAAKHASVYSGPLKGVVAGLIDEVLTTPPTGARLRDHFGRPFGGRRFDLVIDSQSNFARSLFARRTAEDFVSASGRFLLSRSRPAKDDPWPDGMLPRLAKLLELARGRPVPLRPVTLADPRALAAAQALLPDGPRYVGLAPGAGGPERRWPLERYIALAAKAMTAGFSPVFLLGPSEAGEERLIRAALPDALLPQFDRIDAYPDVDGPLLTIALAGRMRAAVANDGGPAHMLAAGGAPLLSLFKDRYKSVKFKTAAARQRQLIAEDDGPTMAAISVEAAWRALESLLSEDEA